MAKKNVTIDDLAVMVQKGFNDIGTKMALKSEVNTRFVSMDKRFDKIESLILENHRKRIEKIEAEIKELRELFAM